MESFKIAVCATLVLGSISSGAAQPVTRPQIHSHASQTGHSTAIHAPQTKGLPRSTVNGGQPARRSTSFTPKHQPTDRPSISRITLLAVRRATHQWQMAVDADTKQSDPSAVV